MDESGQEKEHIVQMDESGQEKEHIVQMVESGQEKEHIVQMDESGQEKEHIVQMDGHTSKKTRRGSCMHGWMQSGQRRLGAGHASAHMHQSCIRVVIRAVMYQSCISARAFAVCATVQGANHKDVAGILLRWQDRDTPQDARNMCSHCKGMFGWSATRNPGSSCTTSNAARQAHIHAASHTRKAVLHVHLRQHEAGQLARPQPCTGVHELEMN